PRGHSMLNSLTRRGAGRAALAAAASFGLIVALAACSASPGAEEELDTASAQSAYDDWALDFDACMTAEGVGTGVAISLDGESGGMSGSTPSDVETVDLATFEAANKKCIAKVGEPPVQPGMPSEEEINEMGLIFAKCMRDA